MIIVSGSLYVDPSEPAAYLDSCRDVMVALGERSFPRNAGPRSQPLLNLRLLQRVRVAEVMRAIFRLPA